MQKYESDGRDRARSSERDRVRERENKRIRDEQIVWQTNRQAGRQKQSET